LHLAEEIWPSAESQQSLDCLYKACRHLRKIPFSSIIHMSQGEMRVSLANIRCDLVEFRAHYAARQDIARCEAAVELYRGPLLSENCYEWSNAWEAYYDIRYLEMLRLLAEHYEKDGNAAKAAYYRSKLGTHMTGGR